LHAKLWPTKWPYVEEIVPGIAVVTPDFIENWSLDEEVDHSPFLTRIWTAAAQTERAKLHNKIKRPEKVREVNHVHSFC
jgi:hypothetical protein